MRTGSKSIRVASWIAILAMALNALWPLLANARPAGVAPLTEICTAQGMKSAAGDPAALPDDTAAKHLQAHCALCSFGADNPFALPSIPLHAASEPASGSGPLPAILFAEPGSDIRTPAHPRAPPPLLIFA